LAPSRKGSQAVLPSHSSLALLDFDMDLLCTAPLDHVINAEVDDHGVVWVMAEATAATAWRHAVATAGC